MFGMFHFSGGFTMRTVSVIATALMLSAAPVFAQTATPAKTPPAITTPAKPADTMTKPASAMPSMGKMNVNTATEAQLASIPGVGPALAAAIVAARPFKNSADLIKRVKGIGPKNYVSLHLNKAFSY
jgi:competence protein ComEA